MVEIRFWGDCLGVVFCIRCRYWICRVRGLVGVVWLGLFCSWEWGFREGNFVYILLLFGFIELRGEGSFFLV